MRTGSYVITNLFSGKWVVMARKKQQIKIVIHRPEGIGCILSKQDIEDFWREKIENTIRKSNMLEFYNADEIKKLSDQI